MSRSLEDLAAEMGPVTPRPGIQLGDSLTGQGSAPAVTTLASVGEMAPFGERWVSGTALLNEPEAPVQWLIQEVWPVDCYGAVVAPPKAGKSWLLLDMAVSVATGTPFLGHYPVEEPRKVMYYWCEGSKRGLRRRLRSILQSKGLTSADLHGLHFRLAAPNLLDDRSASPDALATVQADILAERPDLVILDPLFLSLPGIDMSSVTVVGGILNQLQRPVQEVGGALVVAHHTNRGQGAGMARSSGAGLMEWARNVWMMDATDQPGQPPGASMKRVKVDLNGGELDPHTWGYTIRTESADVLDLTSELRYEVTEVGRETAGARAVDEGSAKGAILKALDALGADSPEAKRTRAEIHQRATELGWGGAERSLEAPLKSLADEGLIDRFPGGAGKPTLYRALPPVSFDDLG